MALIAIYAIKVPVWTRYNYTAESYYKMVFMYWQVILVFVVVFSFLQRRYHPLTRRIQKIAD